MSIRLVSETATTITIGWDAVAGQEGYVTTLDGSETMADGKRHASISKTVTQVKLGKVQDGKPHAYGVKVLGATVEGAVTSPQAPAPPPPPPPPPLTLPIWGKEPYSAGSPWHKTIEADAPIHPDSLAMITRIVLGGYGKQVGWGPISGYPYSRWLGPREIVGRWWVKASETLGTIVCSYPTAHTTHPPLPSNFVLPHFGSDTEKRTVIHVDNGDSWGGYGVSKTSTGYAAAMFDLRKLGARWGDKGDGTDWSVSSGASRCPFDAGALSPHDFLDTPDGGSFDHAINVNISSTSDGSTHPRFVYPAFQGDGKTAGVSAIPVGARIRLKRSVNVEARPEPEWLKKILRTMQIKGLIVTDTASGQGIGDGIPTILHECGPAGFTYPFASLDSYSNGVPLDLMTEFEVIDWTKWT